MVVAKVFQIRLADKTVVFKFYDGEKEIGSRGITYGDDFTEYLKTMTVFDFLNLKENGVEVPTEINDETPIVEKLSYNAYQEYLAAKEIQEQNESQIIQ